MGDLQLTGRHPLELVVGADDIEPIRLVDVVGQLIKIDAEWGGLLFHAVAQQVELALPFQPGRRVRAANRVLRRNRPVHSRRLPRSIGPYPYTCHHCQAGRRGSSPGQPPPPLAALPQPFAALQQYLIHTADGGKQSLLFPHRSIPSFSK